MKIAFFDTHGFERKAFDELVGDYPFELHYLEPRLTKETAPLAKGSEVICAFVNDNLGAETLQILADIEVKLIALRSAGFNHVDLEAAQRLKLRVVRVPEYSPYAVAEHAVALMLTLNRKIHRAASRVHEGNFSLNGLTGFDLHGKTIGIIGTGKIGSVLVKIMHGFGCHILLHDQHENKELISNYGAKYVSLESLLRNSDIISLHVPLNPSTHHLLSAKEFQMMKNGVMLINTGRGALIDTKALIASLKSEKVGYAGLDVYEEEEGIFFEDLSDQLIQDDVLARLLTFPNVILTSHQAFLTREALRNIAETTLDNISAFAGGKNLTNEVCLKANVRKA